MLRKSVFNEFYKNVINFQRYARPNQKHNFDYVGFNFFAPVHTNFEIEDSIRNQVLGVPVFVILYLRRSCMWRSEVSGCVILILLGFLPWEKKGGLVGGSRRFSP